MIQIFYAYTDIVRTIQEDLFIKQLSPRTQDKLPRLRRVEDRHLIMTSFILLRQALCHNGFNTVKLCDVQYNEVGRPFFPDSSFDFNISHTNTCAAVAFSKDCRVGIDVEKIEEIDVSDFTEYFTREQWEDIHTAKDMHKRFFHYWTLLESAVKADGRGLPLISTKKLQLNDGVLRIDNVEWFYRHCDFDRSISCCITSDKNTIMPEIQKITSL